MSTATETTTPEATAEVLSLLDEALAKAMADYRAQAVIDNFVAFTIAPYRDTKCVVCEHPLPAGATGYRDKRDPKPRPVLCVDCVETELEAAGRTA